jgi:hypothetical protein
MSDSSGAEVTNHIASQYKPDHGILARALITIKLMIFHAKVTWLPCALWPDFWCSFTAVHYADSPGLHTPFGWVEGDHGL